MNSQKILEIKNLSVSFSTPDGLVRAVENCSLDLRKGEIIAIVGESGSGKTITALSLMRLLPKSENNSITGKIFFNGQELLSLKESAMRKIRGNAISMIFQNPMAALNPVLKIGNQIREAILVHQKMSKKEATKKSIEYLEMVNIPRAKERFRDYPHQFSGGMRQRVMIAMALSCSPDLLIADEPTTALDATIESEILDLIVDLKNELHFSVVLISHDLGVVAKTADRVVVMYAGKPVEEGDVNQIFYHSSHPYTLGLLASMVRLDGDKDVNLSPIGGVPPNPIDLPVGCSFSPRCMFAQNVCLSVNPELTLVGQDHRSSCHFGVKSNFLERSI